MGFGACDVGPSVFLGWGSLYKRKIINLGKNGAADNKTIAHTIWCFPKVLNIGVHRHYFKKIGVYFEK